MTAFNITEFVQNRTFQRHHAEVREMWQARALIHVHEKGDRKLAAVLLSMLAHAYPSTEAIVTLMQACFPGFVGIRPPFYESCGKIMAGGEVAADLRRANGATVRNTLVFGSTKEFEGAFRTLADALALSDADRVEMFKVVKAWIVADFRLDPNRSSEAA